MSHHGLIQRSSISIIMPEFSTSGWVIHNYLSLMITHAKKVFIGHFAIYFSRYNSFLSMISYVSMAVCEAFLGRLRRDK